MSPVVIIAWLWFVEASVTGVRWFVSDDEQRRRAIVEFGATTWFAGSATLGIWLWGSA